MNNILGQLNNLSEGIGNFNTFLTESQKTDQYDMEASNYRIGDNTYTDADGKVQPLTFNQLAEVNNTNPKALSYVQKKDEYGAVDTFLTVKNSKYGSFEVNISDLNAAQIQNKLALKADYGTETTSHIKENPVVEQITTGSIGPNNTSSYTTTQVINGKDVKVTVTGKKITDKTDGLNKDNARAFALKSMGEDDFNELMPSFLNGALKRTDMFSSKEQKDNYKAMLTALQTDQGMKNYAETNGLSLDEAKQSIKDNVNSVIQKSLENEYLKRTGSYEWDSEKREYVPAILDAKRSVSEAPVKEDDKDTGSGFGFGSTPGLSDASRILAQINFNQSGAPGASLNYFKGIKVKGGEVENPRIVREGKNKFLVYDVNTGTTILEAKDKEQRFNLSDTEDRANLARLKALTLTGADEGTDATIESLPQAIKLRTNTQDVFGFYSLENREKGITGQSKYAEAILTPGWKSWWDANKEKYKNLQSLDRQEQIQRSASILKDFNKSIEENPLLN